MIDKPYFSADYKFYSNLIPIPPIVTRERFAELIGLPVTVFIAQCERGYWPTVTIGKRCLVNVEAVRIAAVQKAEFTL
jgi:hypothetical protein